MKATIWTRPFYYIIAFLFASISLYPIILMVLSSFKPSAEIFMNPLSWPEQFSLDTYRTLLERIPFIIVCLRVWSPFFSLLSQPL